MTNLFKGAFLNKYIYIIKWHAEKMGGLILSAGFLYFLNDPQVQKFILNY